MLLGRSVLLLFLLAGAGALVTRPASADVPAGATEYTVQKGDTCASIATRFYGDARRVDLIHDANPNMGVAPHDLKAGKVLVLPPKPAVTPPAPDARLTKLRNQVEVQAPEPRAGKPNDPLFRGNRVGTKESSTADVTFRDETRVLLGENTLVVILGDANARAARLNALESTLVTGSLRARLSELAGKGTAKPSVATSSGAVVLKDGEAQVTVDEKKTTRLAVYKGASTLTAQKKAVDVVDGFGSKAETGRGPTPPRPLPVAPTLQASAPLVVLATQDATDLSFTFAAGAATLGLSLIHIS